jgi:hypothetical protein
MTKKKKILKKNKIRKSNSFNKKRKLLKKEKKPKNFPVINITDKVVSSKTKEEEVSKKRPGSGKMYFTKETEDSIICYNNEPNELIKNQIFETKIKYSLEKLVENVFNTFKFTYFDVGPLEVQKETLSHLVANLHKYESGKGKAFAYFSIIAKNYLIFHNNSNYKRYNQQVDISEENEENTVRLQTEDPHYKSVENQEFIEMMVNYWDKNINEIFSKKRDLKIAEAVVELFRNSDRIDYFNKKALYLYIREISSCKTQQITKVINKMKEYQEKITKMYIENGKI